MSMESFILSNLADALVTSYVAPIAKKHHSEFSKLSIPTSVPAGVTTNVSFSRSASEYSFVTPEAGTIQPKAIRTFVIASISFQAESSSSSIDFCVSKSSSTSGSISGLDLASFLSFRFTTTVDLANRAMSSGSRLELSLIPSMLWRASINPLLSPDSSLKSSFVSFTIDVNGCRFKFFSACCTRPRCSSTCWRISSSSKRLFSSPKEPFNSISRQPKVVVSNSNANFAASKVLEDFLRSSRSFKISAK
mmetsp:Transcript_18814/g.40948  ORF Transcript_18814/g.40948 Transcript_18814/m.40948 type:complete len:249 (-) Transcript_18814:1065-1811(-)